MKKLSALIAILCISLTTTTFADNPTTKNQRHYYHHHYHHYYHHYHHPAKGKMTKTQKHMYKTNKQNHTVTNVTK